MKRCSICEQKMDIFTTVHKNIPFVDGKTYPAVCFTCYFAPKTESQKYDKHGNVEEDISLPYSCENLCSAKELYESGASDSLKQAKNSLAAVQKLCATKSNKTPEKRPLASWNIS